MKICHIADVHLDYKQYGLVERFNDFCRAWLDVIERIVEEKPDICIIAGDLFHNRQIAPESLSFAVAGLTNLLEHGIITYAVEGNHEQPRTADEVGWMEFLADEGYLRLLRGDHDVFYLDNVPWHIYGYPWMGNATNQVLSNINITTKNNILVLHAGYIGMNVGSFPGTISEETMSKLTPQFDYIALGHIHKPYMKGPIYNPGSIETVSATEADWPERGLIIWEHFKHELITTKRRPFYRELTDPIDPDGVYQTSLNVEGVFHVVPKIERKRPKTEVIVTDIQEILAEITDLDPNAVITVKDMVLNDYEPERIINIL